MLNQTMVDTQDRVAPVHHHRIVDRRLRRHHRGDSHRLTALGGISAMSLDALSSVAYGPEAIVLGLIAAGTAAVTWTVPIALAITALLLVLVVSYRQVIAVHPDGGGSYAVAKKDLGRWPALLAAASLLVDYVLTVAVSLAAGAASLASVFPPLSHHLLALTLAGLAVIYVINLIGIAESAKVLMGPTLLFIVGIFAIVGFGFFQPHPVAVIGDDLGPVHATEAIGIILVLKAFSAGCSSLTGVEAIANAVPAFRSPAVKRAQHCEIALGILLGAMLLGLAFLIRLHGVVPRGNVTVLAQLSAAAFGTGWPFYVINLAVTLVLAFAANTSFGGLPVLMQLLAKDHRLPHLFALRAEKPVFRYGVTALAILAAVVLLIVTADTQRLLPVFAIGVFIGFTISQTGLVLHWRKERGPRWLGYAFLNGFGAALTAVAGIVLLASKFTEGAWLLLFLVPGLVLLMDRIERYYAYAGKQLGLGRIPGKPGGRHCHRRYRRRPDRRGQLRGRAGVADGDAVRLRSRSYHSRSRSGVDSAAERAMARVGSGIRAQGAAESAPQPGRAHRPVREIRDRQRPRRHCAALAGRATALATPVAVQPARSDSRGGASSPHQRDHRLGVSSHRVTRR